MTRKQKRTMLIGTALGGLAIAIGLVLFALNDTIVFFYSPSDLAKGRRAGSDPRHQPHDGGGRDGPVRLADVGRDGGDGDAIGTRVA